MLYLKQSTATQAVILGPFIDEDDGKTTEEALTIANTDIRLSANGGNMFSKTSGGGTHDEAGWYTATFDATDTATVGRLQVSVHVAGALPVWMEFQVLEEDIYDALIAASAAAFDSNQRVSVGTWLAQAVTLSATTLKPQVDVDSIDDDAAAANNLEADYDGTGYAKANSTMGTVTTNTDVRGTDNAFLASVGGLLTDVAADGDPTTTETLMQYLKQVINTLEGSAGMPVWPAEAQPANAVSLAEAIRAMAVDVAGLNGDVMVGTDSAALASVATEARLSELDEATAGKMANQVDIIQTDTTTDIPGTITTLQSDTDDIQTRLPAALITGRMSSDVEAINDNVTAAVQLALSANEIESGACEGTPTTTTIQTDLAETQDDIYIGRVVIFTSGNARGEATDITDYTGSSGTLEVTALANAPSATDTFILI